MTHPYPQSVIDQIRSHAESDPEHEVCGIVVGDEVIRGKNVAEEPDKHFALDAGTDEIRVKVNPEDVAVYHTHLQMDSPYFSPHDAEKIMQGLYKALVYHVPTGFVSYWDPLKKRPYETRPWNYLFDNCYALVREWLWREMEIHMDWFQLWSDGEWNTPRWNRFEENLPGQNFKQIIAGIPRKDMDAHALQKGDLILMQFGSCSHIAVMTNPAKNQILHHMQDHLSRFAPYGSDYRNQTAGVWRHVSRI